MKKYILLMCTNGAGLGHLTRGLAVAKQLRKKSADYEIIVVTTSLATEVIREMGFMYYYLPTYELMPKQTTFKHWNQMLYELLQHLITLYHPKALIYDGASPYLGIVNTINQKYDWKTFWIKREGDKPGYEYLEEYQKIFTQVIVPMELGMEYDRTKINNKEYVAPIVLPDKKESFSRQEIRDALGIKEEQILYYVQLGAGTIQKVEEKIHWIVEELVKKKENYILIGESIIGPQFRIREKQVSTIRSYPNYYYYPAVDRAISAAGYNTTHELAYYGIPTVFIPNRQIDKDDQMARAKRMERLGIGLCALERDNIINSIQRMDRGKIQFINKIQNLGRFNGAKMAAAIILECCK